MSLARHLRLNSRNRARPRVGETRRDYLAWLARQPAAFVPPVVYAELVEIRDRVEALERALQARAAEEPRDDNVPG